MSPRHTGEMTSKHKIKQTLAYKTSSYLWDNVAHGSTSMFHNTFILSYHINYQGGKKCYNGWFLLLICVHLILIIKI